MSIYYRHLRPVITGDILYRELRGDKGRSDLRIWNHMSDVNGRKVMWSYVSEVTCIFTSLGTLAKLREKVYRLRYICLSARTEQLGSH